MALAGRGIMCAVFFHELMATRVHVLRLQWVGVPQASQKGSTSILIRVSPFGEPHESKISRHPRKALCQEFMSKLLLLRL
ncbi:hypothetical protein BJY52DRAFT_767072 [Lactarius psammicola]|nr:hypothetical protein BJY52DRAFT_767072 [Lactarius psammicola]